MRLGLLGKRNGNARRYRRSQETGRQRALSICQKSDVLGRILHDFTLEILFYLALTVIAFNLFVRRYEEPHLRKIFGEQYLDYCQRVPRWLPRFHTAQ